MFSVVEEFLENARVLDSDEALCDAFQKAVGELGCTRFAAFSEDTLDGLSPGGVALERFPTEWLVYSLERQAWKKRRDPLPRISRQETRPFLWDDPRITARFTKDERAFVEEARDAGVYGGLLIPVRTSFATLGSVSVFGDHMSVDERWVAKLHNLAVYFYDIARRSAARRADIPEQTVDTLSARERECLLWLSAGKSDWDISAITTISEVEVKRHIARAMYKFGVPTRTQAVVQAVMSNQIVP